MRVPSVTMLFPRAQKTSLAGRCSMSDDAGDRPRIVLISYCMSAYQWARARAAAKCQSECTFVELCSEYAGWKAAHTRDSGAVAHICLFPGRTFQEIGKRQLWASLRRELERLRPDALFLPGYDAPCLRKAARWAKSHTVASVVCMDTWEGTRKRHRTKELFKRLFVNRLYDGAFVAGERAAHYAQTLGIEPHRIWRGWDVVDNQHFAAGADEARAKPGLRDELGLPDDYAICVGRFVPQKNLPTLIEAFADYRRRGGTVNLVLVGYGPLKDQLEATICRLGASDAVQIRPKAGYDELPALYGLARYAILPSVSETWGLVVNEAMAAGLPVLVSDRCGCAPELCQTGVNGFTYPHNDAERLADLMLRMSDGSVDPAALGEASRKIISGWSPDTWAQALLACAAGMA